MRTTEPERERLPDGAVATPPPQTGTHVAPRGAPGLLARLGGWCGAHVRAVVLGWLVVLGVFGAFAPHVDSALSGAGWQDSGSQSVQVRNLVGRDFDGLNSTALQVVVVDSKAPIADDPSAGRVVVRAAALLRADPRVASVVMPTQGTSLSRDGRTAIIQAGANADANAMVRAASDLTSPLRALSTPTVSVQVTGSSSLWADFNA